MLRLLLILFVLLPTEINGVRRRCINSGVLFPDKVFRSPFVVYGEALAKNVYLDTNTELLFNVTFRVDCVFKGEDVTHKIEITEAGVKSGHTACQWIEPGKSYVVFLEQWGTNANSYRPLDFQESIAGNMTYELLTKTCHLKRIQPLHSTANSCPDASAVKYCPHDDLDISVMPKEKSSNDRNTDIKSSYFNTGNQFYLQSKVTIPKDGSSGSQVGDYQKSDACSSAIVWISTIIFAGFIPMIL